MIDASRFIVQSKFRDEWMFARANRLTATTIAHAATPSGFKSVLSGGYDVDNPFTRFGREAEESIVRHAHTEHGILPSDWLITAEHNPFHAATPDGISLDHREIAEAKTTGTDWRTIPATYRRQVQWQLYVTGADRCLFLWQLRKADDIGWFYTPWLEPKTEWIDRDDTMITELIGVAERLTEAGYAAAA